MMPVVSHPRTSNYSRGNGQNRYESSNRFNSFPRRGDNGRGGYDSSRGGYDSSRGGYDSSRGGYDSSRGGYDSSRGGYDSSRGGYDSSRGGYDSSRGGYDSSRGGYDSGRGGYDSGRGGYDNSRGYNGYNGYSGFGSGRGRSQRLDLRVSNLQPNASLAELREFFSGYGHLDKITMDTRELGTVFTGTVYLIYRPPPETEFWRQNPRFHGKQLRIEVTSPRRPENDQSNFSKERRSQDFLLAKSLEMGVFLQEDTFVREWKTDNNVKFKLNYTRRSFEIEFGFTKGNGGKTYRFRLETYFKDVE
ncbi:9671_t:CDS:2, partial [Paraglomus brasilianum]